MRFWLGILFVLGSACGDDSAREPVENPADKVRTLDDSSNFQDFGAQLSSDGQRAAFISRRDAGSYRVYLYDETSQPKLKAFADRQPLEGTEAELNVALSQDGEWILLNRKSESTHRLILSRWDGQLVSELALPNAAQLTELSITEGSARPYFAYATRTGSQTTIKVYSFDPNTAQASLVGQIDGASRPLLSPGPQGQLVLFSLAQTSNKFAWHARVFDPSSNTWSEAGSPQELGKSADQNAPAAASPRGLVFASSLNKPKLKTKLGTNEDRPEGYVADVGVLDRLNLLDPFNQGAGSLIDFEAANYKPFQPLAVTSLSLSSDGSYALITGSDTYFCKSRQLPLNFFQLVRLSDMVTIPLFAARSPGDANGPWTQLITDVCGVYDAEAPSLEVDGGILRASLEGNAGNQFRITYESQRNGEREVYRASFAIEDWDRKAVNQSELTNLSENRRP